MRLLLVASARPGAVVELGGADYHYLVRVLRLRTGDEIPVADAAGHRAHATITKVSDTRVRLFVGAAEEPAASAAAVALTLVQALPKGALMDRIVRQATELGVSRIVPVTAERSQGRAEPAALQRRRQRWQRIARQAAQQSGSPPPAIEPPAPLPRYLHGAAPAAIALLFAPGAPLLLAGTGLPPTALATTGAPTAAAPPTPVPAPEQSPLEVRCAIGPEGDFSPAEADLFRDHGYQAVGLPAGVLRVDTAAVAALIAVRLLLAGLSDA
jgi:16S rRNA (uracil1498-N3)-methyltransferase